jgi:hypothetical protein
MRPNNEGGVPRRDYFAATRGFLLSEIAKRVDPQGRNIGQIIEDEIAKPLGITRQQLRASGGKAFFLVSARLHTRFIPPGIQDPNHDPIMPYFARMKTSSLIRSGVAKLLLADVHPLVHPVERAVFKDLFTPTSPLALSIQHGIVMGDVFAGPEVYTPNMPVFYKQSVTSAGILTNSRWGKEWRGFSQRLVNANLSLSRSAAGKILAAIANYGELDGIQVLKKETVEKMLANTVRSPPATSPLLKNIDYSQGGVAILTNEVMAHYGCASHAGVMASDSEVIAGWL